MIVTKQDLDKARTVRGSYSGKQVKLGQQLTGERHWLQAMVGLEVEDSIWLKFVQYGKNARNKKKKEKKPKILNPVSKKHDSWAWKPTEQDVPRPKFKGKLDKNRGRNKKRKQKLVYNPDFYNSAEWRKLRARVLEKYECRCMMCGRSPKDHGIVVHVDHIKPRSKYPELALEFSNLQILCEDCNMGKGNRYDTDYRPDVLNEEERDILLDAINALS